MRSKTNIPPIEHALHETQHPAGCWSRCTIHCCPQFWCCQHASHCMLCRQIPTHSNTFGGRVDGSSQTPCNASTVATNKSKIGITPGNDLRPVTKTRNIKARRRLLALRFIDIENSFKQYHDSHHSIEVLYIGHGLFLIMRALERTQAR